MKKILSSLPVRLIIGVVIGIIIGLGSADLWIGGTDVGGTIMQVVLTLKNLLGLTDQFLCPADHHRLYCPVYHPSAEQCLPDAGPGAGTGLYLLSMRRTDVNGGRLRHHPRPVHPVGGGGAEGGAGAAVQPGHRARHVGDVRAGLFCVGGPGGHLDPGQGHHPGAGGVPAGGAGGGLSGGDPHPALLYRGHLLRAGL